MSDGEARRRISGAIAGAADMLVDAVRRLVAAASPNPPGDVTAAAAAAAGLLRDIPGARVERFEPAPGVVNLVAVIDSGRRGRRLCLNGHLDTFPVGEKLGWKVPPLSGLVRDGRIYGRGVADMKGGVAASLMAARALAGEREAWRGQLVVTLAGDEETMGRLGSLWLLEHVPQARADAMLSGDAGSPLVVRFGEKGLLWLEIEACGRPAHGAHVHKGVNAIDRLRAALDALKALEALPVAPPAAVRAAIAQAGALSEELSGRGETDILERLTVNIGVIEGGVSPNLIPAWARAQADIRLPAGISTGAVEDALCRRLAGLEGVSFRITNRWDPTWTDPGHEIVRRTVEVATEVLGRRPVANMRVGASDARLYRMHGIPSVVLGCTPFNMGGADEHVLVDELVAVARVHALTAFDYLAG
jgi:acetylornithine deacetylase/succinyl-diaminopimelate desuccinylase-like protein